MAPFRLAKPRFLAFFAFEGGLIFAVLYGLAYLTHIQAQRQPWPDLASNVAMMGGMFCVLLLATHLSDQATLRREILLFSVVSIVLGLSTFAVLRVMFPQQAETTRILVLEVVAM